MGMLGAAFGCEGDFTPLFVFLMAESTSRYSLNEAPSTRFRSVISPAISIAFCLGFITLNLMTFVFMNAQKLLWAMIVIISLLIAPNLFLFVESPVWLASEGRIREAIKSLKEISRINTMSDKLDSYFDRLGERLTIEEARKSYREAEPTHNHSFWSKLKELFSTKKLLQPLFILTIVSASVFVWFFAVFSQAQHLGFKTLQMNGIVFGISQVVGYIILLPIVAKIPRKTGLISSQIGLIVCGAVLFILSHQSASGWAKTVSGLISTLVVSALLAAQFSFMTLLNSESFPSSHRGMAVGLILSIGKVLGSTAPYVSHWAKEKHLHVLVGCTLSSIPAMMLGFFLKETLRDGQELEQQNKETTNPGK